MLEIAQPPDQKLNEPNELWVLLYVLPPLSWNDPGPGFSLAELGGRGWLSKLATKSAFAAEVRPRIGIRAAIIHRFTGIFLEKSEAL